MRIELHFNEGYADACVRALRNAGYALQFSSLHSRLVRLVARKPPSSSGREEILPKIVVCGRTKGEALHFACDAAGVTPL